MTVVAYGAKSANVLRSSTPPQHMANDPLRVKLKRTLNMYEKNACAKTPEWTRLFKLCNGATLHDNSGIGSEICQGAEGSDTSQHIAADPLHVKLECIINMLI